MKKKYLFLQLVLLLVLSCSKEGEASYAYWSRFVSEKYEQINTLTQSVRCTNINDFELVSTNGYYLVHPSIKSNFDGLMLELDGLNEEANRAADREGIAVDLRAEPNPPLGKECRDGKPRLIYADDLSLEQINEELPVRYTEIQNFYNDVPCTNPEDWYVRLLFTGCCSEPVIVHKTIRTQAFLEKVFIYSNLIRQKGILSPSPCPAVVCPTVTTPITCVNGRPFVEFSR